MQNFTVTRIYSISNNIRFMKVNLININGIFAHKSYHVSTNDENLVKTLKFHMPRALSKIDGLKGKKPY